MIPGLPPPFLHTASDQKLDDGKAWERGYHPWAFFHVTTVSVGYCLVRTCPHKNDAIRSFTTNWKGFFCKQNFSLTHMYFRSKDKSFWNFTWCCSFSFEASSMHCHFSSMHSGAMYVPLQHPHTIVVGMVPVMSSVQTS